MKYLLLFVVLIFSGCTKTVYVDKIVYVDVPVKCNTPATDCSEEGSLTQGTMSEILMCIYDLREANKVCK